MVKPSNKYYDYCYFIIDEEQRKFNCFVLTMPRVQWDTKLNEARESGKNVHQQYFEKEKLDEYKQIYIGKGYEYTDRLLIGEAYNNTREYTKKLPKYAEDADLNKVLIINCCLCNGKWGELNTIYPGMETLHKAESNIYTAKCLTCKCEVNDNYNWYRDDKTNN